MLESTAAERACDLRPEEAVPRVERLLKAMETSVDRPKIFMRRNTQFHFSIYSYADSPLLLEIINRLWARVFPYVFTHFFITQDNSKAMKRHWKMFQGLAERNKKKLTDALREDLEAAAAVIIPALEKSASHRTR